jgi:hypothetical protein
VIEPPSGTAVEALPNTGAGQQSPSGNPLTTWFTIAVAVLGALIVGRGIRQRFANRQ